jgi:hypothetical protein
VLAALIATRLQAPPPPVARYTNQLVAAVTTFSCITVARRAAFLTTSLPTRYLLDLSVPGQPSILDRLTMNYGRIINYLSSDANMIPLPIDLYLSDQIAAVVATVVLFTGILASLPVAPQNVMALTRLQQQLARDLAVLYSLAQ